MILKRKIYKKLLEWKKECQGKKALQMVDFPIRLAPSISKAFFP